MKVLGDYILVKEAKPEAKSAGGIVLPGNQKSEPGNGFIVQTGDKVVNHDIREGVNVIFPTYAGSRVIVLGEPMILIREPEIAVIL